MKKGIVIAAVLVLAAGAAGGGWYLYEQGYFSSSANSDEQVYVTDIATLMGRGVGTQSRFSGVVEPQDTVEVNIDNGRVVRDVAVKQGEEVKKGQLLFEYDLTSIQSDLQQAQLDLERLQNEAGSLQDQITTLEKEKKTAKADSQLSYTIEIESNKLNLKKNEYDQKSKQAEIDKLQSATGNTEVRSDIDGIIQKIDTSKMNTDTDSSITDELEESGGGYSDSDGSSNAFITILSTGAYRVKGSVNELNINDIMTGSPVIIRSRVNENQTWTGTMGSIDMESSSKQENNSYSYYGMGSDSNASSTSYPFYVELDSSDGLMLGQHVFIEQDNGQMEQKEGLWLSDYFIVDADQEEPYVWISDDRNRLRKQKVVLGQHDDGLMEYEILEGLTEDTMIAFPAASLEEGMSTVKGTGEQTLEAMFQTEDESMGEYEEYTDDTESYENFDYGDVITDEGENVYDASDFDESGLDDSSIEWTDEDSGMTEDYGSTDFSDDMGTVVEDDMSSVDLSDIDFDDSDDMQPMN